MFRTSTAISKSSTFDDMEMGLHFIYFISEFDTFHDWKSFRKMKHLIWIEFYSCCFFHFATKLFYKTNFAIWIYNIFCRVVDLVDPKENCIINKCHHRCRHHYRKIHVWAFTERKENKKMIENINFVKMFDIFYVEMTL